MNLHGLVAGQIGAVNPFIPGSIQISTGYNTAPSGMRVSTYATLAVRAQVQAMTYKDLMQVDGLNLNGTRRGIYLYGKFDGVVRPSEKGGDLITLRAGPNSGVWLVAQVLEQWPDWCKVVATLQDLAPDEGFDLTTEDGQSLLTEDGQNILVEQNVAQDLTTEDGETITTEDGDAIVTEGAAAPENITTNDGDTIQTEGGDDITTEGT